jgi:hypothetical protein
MWSCRISRWEFDLCWAWWSADKQFLGESSLSCYWAQWSKADVCLFLVNLLHCANFILKLLEVGVSLGRGGRWARNEGTYFVCCSCRCLASWWIQASYSRLNLSPAWEENWEFPSNFALLDRLATPDIEDECQAKSRASFLSKLFIEWQLCGHCWLECMVKKLELCTLSQSWLCKFVLGKFARPMYV